GPTNACARASAPNPGRGRGRGNGGGRRSSCGLAVRRSPLKDETTVAIAALDEAGVRLDPQIDPRMAERWRHFARAVAGDLDGFHPNDFRRRDLRYHVRQVATAPPPFNGAELIVLCEDGELAGVIAVRLVRRDVHRAADADEEGMV